MITADDFRHIALAEVQSTNLECLEWARGGDPGNLWITADRQLSGRARRGRLWISEPGNLYASLLLIDPATPTALVSLPLAVAVAAQAAISRVLRDGAAPATIKWPNDILVGGSKVCGILLESETLENGRRAVVIGCGINVSHAPQDVLYPTTTLRGAGASVSPDELFARLCLAVAEALRVWDGGRGVKAVRDAWVANAEGIGRHITVNLPNRTITGQFRDIDPSGGLVLVDQDRHSQVVAAGDVFFD